MAIFPNLKIIAVQDPINELWTSEIILGCIPHDEFMASADMLHTLWKSPSAYVIQRDAEEAAAEHLAERLKALLNPMEPMYAGGM